MLTTLIVIGLLAATIAFFAFRYRAPDLREFDTPRAALVVEEHEISEAHEAMVAKITNYLAASDPKSSIQEQRANMETLLGRDVPATIISVDVDGIAGEWVLAEGAESNKRLLYLHGGGFRLGSPKSHRHITYELSRRAGVAVLAVDYRMLPEHKITACHEDARIAYRWILDNGPDGSGPAEALYVAGDSAGGNMTLAVIAWARDTGLRAADAAVAFAPLTDFTMSGPSWQTNLKTDPFLGPAIGSLNKVPRWFLALATRWSAGKPVNDPQLSPLFGNLADLPPTLIQVSSAEMLYDDAQRYANRANHFGSQVELQVWPKLVHVFQGFPEIPESATALQMAADFIGGRQESAEGKRVLESSL
ncbi:MAG: alpha/beta hydrolase [Pseudomonadota bacterium]